MPLSVALPSFDAFLRSARRSPAVLPHATPSVYCPRPIHTVAYDYYGDHHSPTADSFARLSITPPGSPYYGHFVTLSPTSSVASDTDATADAWAAAAIGSDMEDDHFKQYKPMWYQDLMAQPCISIAPKAAASSLSSSLHKPTALRAKKKYLKERQRCEIVRRVRAGERQAHLAKEFGVSRAAVCYLLKHECEILRRSMLRQQRNKRQ